MCGVTLLDVCLVVITSSSGLWISFYRNKSNRPFSIDIFDIRDVQFVIFTEI